MEDHNKAWQRLQSWIKHDRMSNASDTAAMQRLANDAVEDARGIISDIRQQRESALEPVGMSELKAKPLKEVHAAYTKARTEYKTAVAAYKDALQKSKATGTEFDEALHKSECNIDKLELKQAAIAFYLNYRDGRAFRAAFGVWTEHSGNTAGERLARIPENNKGTLARVLDFLQEHDTELYASAWDQIASTLESIVNPEIEAGLGTLQRIYCDSTPIMLDNLTRTIFDDSKVHYGEWMQVKGVGRVRLKQTAGFDHLNNTDRMIMRAICAVLRERGTTDGKVWLLPINEVFGAFVADTKRLEPTYRELILYSCEKCMETSIELESNRIDDGWVGLKERLLHYGVLYAMEKGKRITVLRLLEKPPMFEIMERYQQIEELQSSIIRAAFAHRSFNLDVLYLLDTLLEKISTIKRMRKQGKKAGRNRRGYIDADEMYTLHDAYREERRAIYAKLDKGQKSLEPRSDSATRGAHKETRDYVKELLCIFVAHDVIKEARAASGNGNTVYRIRKTKTGRGNNRKIQVIIETAVKGTESYDVSARYTVLDDGTLAHEDRQQKASEENGAGKKKRGGKRGATVAQWEYMF